MRSTIVIPVVAILLTACGGEHATHEAGSQPASSDTAATSSAPSTSTADALASLPEASRAPFGALMAGYSSIQTSLAGDTTDGIAAAASAVAGAARILGDGATEPSKTFFAAVATEAANLVTNAGDITKARESFGELSRAMIALLAANPDLAKGRVVVECPMTKNYKKWLQTDTKVKNPHYGNTMLDCGTISTLEP
ncbi:MAG: DUF3347 domain-containing protein [Acidobacteria bacterium]|nr:DUF3347 domain-containing protein [Acidobacteriota bacterium]